MLHSGYHGYFPLQGTAKGGSHLIEYQKVGAIHQYGYNCLSSSSSRLKHCCTPWCYGSATRGRPRPFRPRAGEGVGVPSAPITHCLFPSGIVSATAKGAKVAHSCASSSSPCWLSQPKANPDLSRSPAIKNSGFHAVPTPPQFLGKLMIVEGRETSRLAILRIAEMKITAKRKTGIADLALVVNEPRNRVQRHLHGLCCLMHGSSRLQ